jgi:hypothetical protein
MTFTFGDDGLIVDMKDYITTMLTDFPFALDNKTAPTPAADNLFHIRDSPPIVPTSSTPSSQRIFLHANVPVQILTQQLPFFVHA